MTKIFLIGEDKRFIDCKKELDKMKIKSEIITKISDIKNEDRPQIIVLPFKGVETSDSLYQYLTEHYKNGVFVIYNLTQSMKNQFDINKIHTINLNEDKIFSKMNNIATAESSLKYIIEELPLNFEQIKVAILGYGKCGQEVYDLYKRLGMKVNVYVRRKEVKDLLLSDGFILTDLENNISTYNLIVNTIPYNIIDEATLHNISLNSMLLDLASFPYGCNHEIAKHLGLNTYILKSLPSLYRHKCIAKELANYLKRLLI